MKNPCTKNCKNRSADCHSTCDRYREFFQHNRKQNEKDLQGRRAAQALSEMSSKRAARMQRHVKRDIKIEDVWGK